MPPKKHRTKLRKSKKPSATKRSESRRKPTNSSTRTRSGKQGKTSNKPSTLPKRATIDTLTEIEREARDRSLSGTRGSRPQSDFQGLSRAQAADSESVEELVEEGNVLESGAISGVEEADNEDETEVHTQELPEDDVPDEYLEQE